MRIKFFLAAVFFVQGCASAQSFKPSEFTTVFQKENISLPLTYRNGATPMVEVKVNGKGPYFFMIETGAGGGYGKAG